MYLSVQSHHQVIQDVDEFVSSSEQIWINLALINVWIIVMFFNQLLGYSFWMYSFTAEDPLLSKLFNF